MDRLCENGTMLTTRYIDQDDAFGAIMRFYWSEHDLGAEFAALGVKEAFEDAVYDAIDSAVWERAEDDVKNEAIDRWRRRDMWRYNGVRQRDYYGT